MIAINGNGFIIAAIFMVFVSFNICFAYDGDELDSTGCPNGKEK